MNILPALLVTGLVLVVGGRVRTTLADPRRVNGPDQRPMRLRRIPLRRYPRHAVVAVTVIVALLIDPVLPFGAGVVVLAWPRLRILLDERERRARVASAIPDAIELLVLMIRAGLTPRQAVEGSVRQAPRSIRPGFVEVDRRLHRGDGLAEALRGLPDVLGPGLDPIADTLAIAERHGTPIGDALTQLSAEVRQQRRRAAEADARKLPVRLSFPLVFCTLPSFVLVAIAPAVLAALSSLGDSTW